LKENGDTQLRTLITRVIMRSGEYIFTFPKAATTSARAGAETARAEKTPAETSRIEKPRLVVPTLQDFDDLPQLSKLRRLAQRMDEFDAYTRGHLERLQRMSAAVAEALGLSTEEVAHIRIAALLHDIGKIMIPGSVLKREGPLSDQEWQLMRQHTVHGARITAAHNLETDIVAMVRGHHERWDGNGYPDKLVGEHIPLGARIIGAVDAFDAMTTKRSYRAALSREEAFRRLQKGSETHFDPLVVQVLLGVLNASELAPH
jgi:putative nucleotidyltransferase with HDIG domain